MSNSIHSSQKTLMQEAEEFARWQFKMSERQSDGASLMEHLKVVEKVSGRTPPELLEEPELDELFYECWSWFLRLHQRRTSNGFGVNYILHSELLAFFKLLQYIPQQWELELLELFDSVAMDEISKQQEKKSKKSNSK